MEKYEIYMEKYEKSMEKSEKKVFNFTSKIFNRFNIMSLDYISAWELQAKKNGCFVKISCFEIMIMKLYWTYINDTTAFKYSFR